MSHKDFGNKTDTYRRRSGGIFSGRRQDSNNDGDRDRRRSRSPQTHCQQHGRHGNDERSGGPSPRQRPFDNDPRHYRDNYNRDDNKREHSTRGIFSGGGGWPRRDGDRNGGRGGGRQRDSTTGGNDDRPSWENNSVRRHAEGIQQRKLLWSKPKDSGTDGGESSEAIEASSAGGAPASEKALESAWTSRLAAATTDSQQMSKFQRLMGMKKTEGGVGAGATTTATKETTGGVDSTKSDRLEQERRRQADLTAQLDRQYAAARASTHFGRGKGLGFNG